jgi:hypothetical protein
MNKEKQQIKERLNAQENLYTKEELLALAKRIRPVMRGTKHYVGLRPTGYEVHQILHTTKAMEHLKEMAETGGKLFFVEAPYVATHSYTYEEHYPLLEATGLTEIARITTYHRYGGFPSFLRPSIDEAIYQCPPEILDKVTAFEIVSHSDRFRDIYDDQLDRHVLTTIYYTGYVPEEVTNLGLVW